MREVANRLERMGCINRDIRLAVNMLGPHSDRLQLLRANFGYECNQLHNQLTAKLGQDEQARLGSQILDSFVAVRRLLSAHQQRWTGEQVARQPDLYLAASHRVQAAVLNFIEDALEAIDVATAKAGRRSANASARIAPSASVGLTRTG